LPLSLADIEALATKLKKTLRIGRTVREGSSRSKAIIVIQLWRS